MNFLRDFADDRRNFFRRVVERHSKLQTGMSDEDKKRYSSYKDFFIEKTGLDWHTYDSYSEGKQNLRRKSVVEKLRGIWCKGEAEVASHHQWELSIARGDRVDGTKYSPKFDTQGLREEFSALIAHYEDPPWVDPANAPAGTEEAAKNCQKSVTAQFAEVAAQDLAHAPCAPWRAMLANHLAIEAASNVTGADSLAEARKIVSTMGDLALSDCRKAMKAVRAAIDTVGPSWLKSHSPSARAIEQSAFSLLSLILVRGAIDDPDELVEPSDLALHTVSASHTLGASLQVATSRRESQRFLRSDDGEFLPAGFIDGHAVGILPGASGRAIEDELKIRVMRNLSTLFTASNVSAEHILHRIQSAVRLDAEDNRVFWRIYFDARRTSLSEVRDPAVAVHQKYSVPTVVFGFGEREEKAVPRFRIPEGEIDVLISSFVDKLEAALRPDAEAGDRLHEPEGHRERR